MTGCMEVPRFLQAPPSAFSVANAGHMLQWLTFCTDPQRDTHLLADTDSGDFPTSFPHKTGGFAVVSHNSVNETEDFMRILQTKTDQKTVAEVQENLARLTEDAPARGAGIACSRSRRRSAAAQAAPRRSSVQGRSHGAGTGTARRYARSARSRRSRNRRSRRSGDPGAQTPAPAAYPPPADCRSAGAARLFTRYRGRASRIAARRSDAPCVMLAAVSAASRPRQRASVTRRYPTAATGVFGKTPVYGGRISFAGYRIACGVLPKLLRAGTPSPPKLSSGNGALCYRCPKSTGCWCRA